MTGTDIENTLTIEAGGTCRRLLLEVTSWVLQLVTERKDTSNGLLTAACQRDGHEVSSLSVQNEPRTWKQVVYVVPMKGR
jgi:hypothetical protein